MLNVDLTLKTGYSMTYNSYSTKRNEGLTLYPTN